MSKVVIQGTTIRFLTIKPFTSVAGVPVDPDKVEFSFEVQGGSVHKWTYTAGSGDPTANIVRVGTGNYYIEVDTSLYPAGVWIWSWYGYPSSGTDTSRTKVKIEGTVTVTSATV